ncbi:phage tail protein [Kitasatospora sp. NPDC091257]|uniref:phage tail protein n=1 Tax=unclassified Kitasatospora TaxID=2633591 RepID=UPI002F90CEA3
MTTGNTLTPFRFAIDLGNYQVETVQAVSGLQIAEDVIAVTQVSPSGELIYRKQPGAPQSGQVTVTRGMDKSTQFTNWLKATLLDANLDGARQHVTIKMIDAQKNVVRRIGLVNCWASAWSGADLQADGSGPALETVTLEFEDITVEP